MAKKKSNKDGFKITVKYSSMPEEEKRKLLWQCFDILFAGDDKKKQDKEK